MDKTKKRKLQDLDDTLAAEQDDDIERFQSIDWLKKFQPKEVSDLAVHPKKLEELRAWLKLSENVPNKILILEGPAGCGKTSALKVIAKESGYEVSEWINSTDVETALLRENSENFQSDFVSYENQTTKFTDFLLRASRFQSIFRAKKRLLVVKDFPNTFMKKTEEFLDTLKTYADDGRSPLVFIITETNSKAINVGINLFPDKVRLTLGISTINFNPVSATMMKRGIKRIVQMVDSSTFKLCFQQATEEVIDSLVQQSQGDIRNAILNLNFTSQRSQIRLPVSKEVKSKRSSKKVKATIDGGIGRDEGLSVMHGLGRVFHPKLKTNIKTGLSELSHQPEAIAEIFISQPSNIISLIHSNYIKNFGDIESAAKASDLLSLSDCFALEHRDDRLQHLNLNLVIRATMVLNDVPVGGFRAISAYANKKWKDPEGTSKEKFKNAPKTVNNGHVMSRDDFFCDYNNFLSLIKK